MHSLRSGLWRRKISYKFLDFLSESSCFCIIFQRILRGHEEAGAVPKYFCSTETYWPSSRVKCWFAFCCALLGSCLHRFYKPQVKGSKLQSDNVERDSCNFLLSVLLQPHGWTTFSTLHFWKHYSFRGPQQISFVFSIFWMWIKVQEANRRAEGKVTARCLWASALQWLCWIHPQG